MENKHYWWLLGIILSSAFLFWVLAVIAYKYFDFGIIDEKGIVLTLIGVLATFIVVSNYMQVKEIENKFNKQIYETNKKILELQQILEQFQEFSPFFSQIAEQFKNKIKDDKPKKTPSRTKLENKQ